jgi:hypothetical protein
MIDGWLNEGSGGDAGAILSAKQYTIMIGNEASLPNFNKLTGFGPIIAPDRRLMIGDWRGLIWLPHQTSVASI